MPSTFGRSVSVYFWISVPPRGVELSHKLFQSVLINVAVVDAREPVPQDAFQTLLSSVKQTRRLLRCLYDDQPQSLFPKSNDSSIS